MHANQARDVRRWRHHSLQGRDGVVVCHMYVAITFWVYIGIEIRKMRWKATTMHFPTVAILPLLHTEYYC